MEMYYSILKNDNISSSNSARNRYGDKISKRFNHQFQNGGHKPKLLDLSIKILENDSLFFFMS